MSNDYSNKFDNEALASFTNATRPVASTVPAGFAIWNIDDRTINISDGTNWRDPNGELV